MQHHLLPTAQGTSRILLARCIAAAFTLTSPLAMAATWTVNSCGDANSGAGTTGTLRYTAANATDNDTIVIALSCSTITLLTGAVTFAQNNLTLNGPGAASLVIVGAKPDRVFTHTGSGTLTINNLSIANGYASVVSGNVAGGCVYSAGTVTLGHANVSSCTAYTPGAGRSKGGGVYGKTAVNLKYSVVSGNTAKAGSGQGGYGGGVYAKGSFYSKYSTISGNTAGNPSGFGGGVFAYHNAKVNSSTISGNTAGDNGGGLYTHDFFNSASDKTTIKNSTISGNKANSYIGGVATNAGKVYLYNSSIVFNTAALGRGGAVSPFTYRAPGLATDDSQGAVAVTLDSTLIANNTYGSTEYDLSVPKRSSTTVTFSGSNNLVRATFAAVPAGTIKLSCPLLGPLRDNGGLTRTHALLSHSPGIDVGNNIANLTFDQRNSGFARVSGSAADIGAYEVQQIDIVFNNGFDGCPQLF